MRIIIFVLGFTVLVEAPSLAVVDLAAVEESDVLAAVTAGLAATDGLTVATCLVTIVLPSAVMTTCFFSSSIKFMCYILILNVLFIQIKTVGIYIYSSLI